MGRIGVAPQRLEHALSTILRAGAIAVLVLAGYPAVAGAADGIDPGLWKVITRTETGGVIGPPHESSKCLTVDQVHDLATTFSPIPQTINSVCSPIERTLNGRRLSWHLVCKGQLDMELTGDFNFDSPHHYSGTVRTQAAMAGMQMVDSQNELEGQWQSECSQQ
jgi:hypothetical protein